MHSPYSGEEIKIYHISYGYFKLYAHRCKSCPPQILTHLYFYQQQAQILHSPDTL